MTPTEVAQLLKKQAETYEAILLAELKEAELVRAEHLLERLQDHTRPKSQKHAPSPNSEKSFLPHLSDMGEFGSSRDYFTQPVTRLGLRYNPEGYPARLDKAELTT